jgi:hypothetical protein
MSNLIKIIKETCEQSNEMGMTANETAEFLLNDDGFKEIFYNTIENLIN